MDPDRLNKDRMDPDGMKKDPSTPIKKKTARRSK
jgi:hypothetical protein